MIGWIDLTICNKTICMGFRLKSNVPCSSDPYHSFKNVLQMSYLWRFTRSAVCLDLVSTLTFHSFRFEGNNKMEYTFPSWISNEKCQLTVHIKKNIPKRTDYMFYTFSIYGDVIKWEQFPRYWPFVRGIHRSPVNSPHKGQWRETVMFSWIYAWINGWVKNREAGDLRRHRAHYDVIVMRRAQWWYWWWGNNIRWYVTNVFTISQTWCVAWLKWWVPKMSRMF